MSFDLSNEVKDQAIADGKKVARGIFALRGDHSEAHIAEQELAMFLALAFEHGVRFATRLAKERRACVTNFADSVGNQ